jgi:hypothetical protein
VVCKGLDFGFWFLLARSGLTSSCATSCGFLPLSHASVRYDTDLSRSPTYRSTRAASGIDVRTSEAAKEVLMLALIIVALISVAVGFSLLVAAGAEHGGPGDTK